MPGSARKATQVPRVLLRALRCYARVFRRAPKSLLPPVNYGSCIHCCVFELVGQSCAAWLKVRRDTRFRAVERSVRSHFEHRRRLRSVRSNGGRNCIALQQQTNTAKL